jgi:hypothetical protein
MPVVSILILIAIFFFIVLVGLSIFLTFHNKRTLRTIDKFIRQASGLRQTIFENIKLRYSETSGLKTYLYPNNCCDLYLFENYLVVVRRQNFIFKVFFAPVLLTSDMTTTINIFNYLDSYKTDQITFNQIVKGEVDIKLIHKTHKHYTADITLKGLTNEQITQLEKIKKWCSQK